MKTAVPRCHELIGQMDPELSNRQIAGNFYFLINHYLSI
jgi:hypothetical protein